MPSAACPITGESLPESDLDVAVVYHVPAPYDYRQCGHEMTLRPLLQQCLSCEGALECPSCSGKKMIVSVCDKAAAKSILEKHDCRALALRFGSRNYFFAVPKEQLAQDRILVTLGQVQILHSGIVIYPDETKSAEDLSALLLEISKQDMVSHKRPSLVVMGAKTGRFGAQAGHLHK